MVVSISRDLELLMVSGEAWPERKANPLNGPESLGYDAFKLMLSHSDRMLQALVCANCYVHVFHDADPCRPSFLSREAGRDAHSVRHETWQRTRFRQVSISNSVPVTQQTLILWATKESSCLSFMPGYFCKANDLDLL